MWVNEALLFSPTMFCTFYDIGVAVYVGCVWFTSDLITNSPITIVGKCKLILLSHICYLPTKQWFLWIFFLIIDHNSFYCVHLPYTEQLKLGIILNLEHLYFCASTNKFTFVREWMHAQKLIFFSFDYCSKSNCY